MQKRISYLVLAVVLLMVYKVNAFHTIPGKFSSVPSFISFDKNEHVSAREFGGWMQQHYTFPAGNGFTLLATEKDQLGMLHYRYRQTVNGIPVENTMYIVHTKNGEIQSINGELLSRLNAPATPELNKQAAIDAALSYTNATVYKWQNKQAEEALKQNTNNPNASYYPNPELVYIGEGNKLNAENFRLAYKVDVYAVEPFSRKYIYVDALTGEVLYTKNRIEHVDAQGTANTQYSGVRTITTDSYNGAFRLREAARGNGIRTYNAQNSTNPGNTDFTDSDNDWNNVNANKDEYATDAHFASEMTYDFYKNKFNRNSLDNNGLVLAAYVHYDTDLDNAFWDGGSMNYGDGSTTYNTTPYTTLDIGGHEITHGLTQYTADLNYEYESGALNESFSDCMGVSIRQYVKQLGTSSIALLNQIYSLGNDNGNAFRSMRNPKTFGQPDTYKGQYWYTGTDDDGGVHTNSGVQNHWFYIVAQGENGTNDSNHVYTVTGIGIEKAQAIAYRTLTVYLTPTSEYAEARFYSIKATEDLYGVCSPEVTTVTNAWYAVAVGPPFVAAVTSNFSVPATSACSVPAIVSFTDASTNAIYYEWNFGDGATSNQQNPSHTYNTYGDFSVKLMSWHPDCGADSITKTQIIHIEDNRPTVSPDTSACNTSVTLSATGNGTINWYNTSAGGNLLNSGTVFATPAVTQNTVYYAENVIPGPSATVAPATQNFGNGGYNNYAHYTVFNNTAPQKLVSVLVDANAAGSRTIQLRDANDAVLKTATVTLTSGSQTVPLNFDLPVANGLRLGIWSGTVGLYRNSSGANYPYTSSNGSLTITSNDVGDLDRFYFFYNWQLKQNDCVSERVPITVNLQAGCTAGVEENKNSWTQIALMPNPASNRITVQLNAEQMVNSKVSIYNVLGETILERTANLNNGNNSLSFDVSEFPAGVYLLTSANGQQTVTKKFVKE